MKPILVGECNARRLAIILNIAKHTIIGDYIAKRTLIAVRFTLDDFNCVNIMRIRTKHVHKIARNIAPFQGEPG